MKARTCTSVTMLALALAGVPSGALGADDLGRLFTTPAERMQLDDARRGLVKSPAMPVVAAAPRVGGAPAADPSALTLRGVVTRGGGRNTAWVNDANTYQGDIGAAHQRVERDTIGGDEVRVKLPDGQSEVTLKVGQTLDPASAHIVDIARDPAQAPAEAPAGQPAPAADDQE